MSGTTLRSELTEDDRVWLSLGPDGYGDTSVRVLPETASIHFRVTGGEMVVELSRFGSRYRVRVVGHGAYAPLHDEGPEIAVLPALGNVVEVGFVQPVSDTVVSRAAITQALPALPEQGS